VLPGNLQAFEESPIFARTNGYLLRWYKDIGSKIQKGELLAAIDTPEIDQELSQARASREQVRSALGLAKISADRWANLRKTDSVSQQEPTSKRVAISRRKPILQRRTRMFAASNNSNAFKNVYAPFSGVLTRRNVDRACSSIPGPADWQKSCSISRVSIPFVFMSVFRRRMRRT